MSGRVVDAGVVGDRDADGYGKLLAQVAVQPVDRIGQGGLLVVHGHDDVEHRHAELTSDECCVGPRFEAKRWRRRHGEVCHGVHVRVVECVDRWQKLCARYEFFGAAVRS